MLQLAKCFPKGFRVLITRVLLKVDGQYSAATWWRIWFGGQRGLGLNTSPKVPCPHDLGYINLSISSSVRRGNNAYLTEPIGVRITCHEPMLAARTRNKCSWSCFTYDVLQPPRVWRVCTGHKVRSGAQFSDSRASSSIPSTSKGVGYSMTNRWRLPFWFQVTVHGYLQSCKRQVFESV